MDDKDTAEDGHRENKKDRLIEELREAVRAREEFVSIRGGKGVRPGRLCR